MTGGPWGDQGVGRGHALTTPPQLLEYEPRSGEQVPLLLKMKRSKLALSKAIESGDTDLGEGALGVCSVSGSKPPSGGTWRVQEPLRALWGEGM